MSDDLSGCDYGPSSWLIRYRVVGASQQHSNTPKIFASGVLFVCWVIFTKTTKFIRHFRRYTAGLKFLPFLYIYSYHVGFLYWCSLRMLHKVGLFQDHGNFVLADWSNMSDDGHGGSEILIFSSSNYVRPITASLAWDLLAVPGIDIHLLEEKLKGLTNLSRAQSPMSDLKMGDSRRCRRFWTIYDSWKAHGGGFQSLVHLGAFSRQQADMIPST